MLHTPIENKDISILLSIPNQVEENFIKDLILSQNFKEVVIVNDWSATLAALAKQHFNVVITRTSLNEENIINKIHTSDFFKQYKTPVIFILRNQILENQMVLKGNFMARFLQERNISSILMNYSIKDLCEQQKLDIQKKENENRYKNLFEHSFDINVIINIDEIIVEGNEQFKSQINKALPDPLEHIFIYSSTYNRFIDLLRSQKMIKRFKAKILINNEPTNCVIDAFTLLNTKQKRVGNHIVIRDVDDDFKMQRLSNRANNLLTTGKFMRSLAHEIRNPLTNIQLAMEQLKDEIVPTEDSTLFFNIIKRSTTRITSLLSKLMDAYKSSEVKLKEEDLVEIVKKSISLAQDRISLKNIRLTTDFLIPQVLVQADFDKMATAILNLIVNASEAMDKEEKTIHVEIDYTRKGKIKLTIEDNAIGMDETQLSALFNPFYTGKTKGIGLGLTTTQNIILAHQWEIDVDSELNVGSKFIITI